MSGGRYELRQPEGHSLEIFVKDLFQGGARRPANTLSGGETFIVSLAMALGLSDMASRKCAVESLFLDEGFGTLDDESLDSAIGALIELSLPDGDKGGGLHRKTVGLISHVAALKERIPAQINVIPIGKGMSRLEGPGCRHIGPDERERLEEMAKDV
ncbi:MAG: hypothetical protein LBW85_05125 [Deltaproteobacteria bacterium]|nr:hypothetical protein [Deltaproteobacteria bacterium]